MTLIRFTGFPLFFLLIMLSGCQSLVPARTPPQLSQTPGLPIIITDNHIDAGWFTLEYPDGWRVVTNVAVEPIRLTLVSPDDALIIFVAEDNCLILDVTAEPGTYWRNNCPRTDERILHLSGNPELAIQGIYDPIFDAVVASVQFN